MARMSIDDMFLRDPRVQRLAKACGWSKFESQGRLLHVFAIVYDRVDAGADDIIQATDIDTAGELDGLSALLIEHGLAEQTRRGVRIRGAKERTKYLETRKETGKQGGIKSGETRRNKAKQQSKVTFEETEGRANPSAVPIPSASASASASAVPSPSPTNTEKSPASPAASGSLFADLKPADTGKRKAKKRSDWSEAERASAMVVLGKLGERNGVQYTGSDAHLKLIINQLRLGKTEMDLRVIVGFCAEKWAGNERMQEYLRPETLFGPENISKYYDPSRAWFRTLPPDAPVHRHDAEEEPEWMRGGEA